MPTIPCPDKVACDCADTPVRNLSSEAPDLPAFLSTYFIRVVPPLGVAWDRLNCQSLCESFDSQESADLCAALQAFLCVTTTWDEDGGGPTNGPVPPPQSPRGRNPVPKFFNTEQSATIFCPDGLPFTFSVSAGRFGGLNQLDADTKAQTYAVRQAQLRQICLSAITPRVCADAEYDTTIVASGAFVDDGAVNLWQLMGTLPPGLSIPEFEGGTFAEIPSNTIHITGTPTVPGNYTFSILVTDEDGVFFQKTYAIAVMGITNGDSLPDGIVGTIYSQPVNAGGVTNPIFSLESGALPDGLSLDPGGIIFGTPTQDGTFDFELGVTEAGTGITCTSPASITIINASHCAETPAIFFDTFIAGSGQSVAVSGDDARVFTYDQVLDDPVVTLAIVGDTLAAADTAAQAGFLATNGNVAAYSAFLNEFLLAVRQDSDSTLHLLFYTPSPLAANGDAALTGFGATGDNLNGVIVNDTTGLAYVLRTRSGAAEIQSVSLTTKLAVATCPALTATNFHMGQMASDPAGTRVYVARSTRISVGANPFTAGAVRVYDGALAILGTFALPNPNGKSMACGVVYNTTNNRLYVIGNDAAPAGGGDVVWVLSTSGLVLQTIRLGTNNFQQMSGVTSFYNPAAFLISAVYSAANNQVAIAGASGSFLIPENPQLFFICCDTDTLVGTVDLTAYLGPDGNLAASIVFDAVNGKYYAGTLPGNFGPVVGLKFT